MPSKAKKPAAKKPAAKKTVAKRAGKKTTKASYPAGRGLRRMLKRVGWHEAVSPV